MSKKRINIFTDNIRKDFLDHSLQPSSHLLDQKSLPPPPPILIKILSHLPSHAAALRSSMSPTDSPSSSSLEAPTHIIIDPALGMNKDSLRSVCQSLGFETGGLEEFFRVATDEWKAHVVTGEWIAAMLDIARLKDTTPTTTTNNNNNNNNNNHFKFAEYDHLWCGFTALSEIRRKQIKEAKSSLHKKRTQEAAASKAAEAATASGGWLSAFTKEDPDAFGKVKKRKLSSLPENSQKFLKKVISPTSELLHNTNMYPGEKRNKVCKGGPDVDLHHQTDDKGGEFVFDDFGDEDGDLDNNEGQPEAHQVDDGNMLVESWEVSERSEQALMKTSMRAASEASSLAKRAA